MSPEHLSSWGWRIPFLFGVLIGPIGYYIRSHLDETPEFLAMRRERDGVGPEGGHGDLTGRSKEISKTRGKTSDPAASFSSHWVNLLLAIGIVAQSTVGVYVLQLYMPLYAVKQLHMPAAVSFGAVVLNGGLQLLLSPVMGAWSDRIGRIRIMLGTSLLMGVLIYPMFALLQSHPTVGWLLLLQGTAGILKAAYSGPMPALMSEIFPTHVRSTGLSIAYSIGVTVFGGFAPTIVETFIHLTGDKLAPSLLRADCCAVVRACRSLPSRGADAIWGAAYPFRIQSEAVLSCVNTAAFWPPSLTPPSSRAMRCCVFKTGQPLDGLPFLCAASALC